MTSTPWAETSATIREILARHEVDFRQAISRSRRWNALDARYEIANFLREERHMSLHKIGSILNRHHTTVIHMLRRFRGQ